MFLKLLLQYRNQRHLIRSTVPWLIGRDHSISKPSHLLIFLQCSKFHTFGQLNRHESDNRLQKKSEHHADDPKPYEISKQMKQLAEHGRIDDAIAVYEKLKQNQRNDFVTLTMVNILVKADRLSEAKEMVTNHKTYESTSSSQTNALLCSIFDCLVHHSDFEELNFFIENLVFKRKYVSRTVLEIIINSLLNKNTDADTVLNIFERMANQFNETPLFQSIACEFIQVDDTERLGQLLEILTKVHGHVNSLYSMAFALNACNCTDQARKIFTSLGIARESERLEQCIENLRLRHQTKLLENLLTATKDCVPQRYREQIYTSLLELYAYKNAKDDVVRVSSAMDEEKIVPTGQMLDKLTQIFKRNGINVPNSWQFTLSDKPDDSFGERSSDLDVQLKSLLDANNLSKANELLMKLLQAGKSLDRKSIRYCLLKNAELANIEIFQHLTSKLDSGTKIQLKFYRYECLAYLNAKKSDEYLQMVRGAMEENKDDLKTVAIQLPENLIDMIESSAEVYEQYLTLAKHFADKGILKPICITWTYNFLNNKNSEDNQAIWKKYLQHHGTILCNVFIKLLLYRKQSEKLREFLNYNQLDKNRIVKVELGKAYSILFDKLYYDANYDGIIDELKKIIPILPIKYLKSNTVRRLKFGPPELKEQFWRVINNAK